MSKYPESTRQMHNLVHLNKDMYRELNILHAVNNNRFVSTVSLTCIHHVKKLK